MMDRGQLESLKFCAMFGGAGFCCCAVVLGLLNALNGVPFHIGILPGSMAFGILVFLFMFIAEVMPMARLD